MDRFDTHPDMLFRQLVLATQQRLHRWLLNRLHSLETARELTQETYLRYLRQRHIQVIDNPQAYLFRTARNLAIDYLRHAAVVPTHDATPLSEELICSQPLPDARAEAAEQAERLRQAILELPPRCREVFLLNKVEQLKYGEIAERLGISVSMVEKHVSKAIKHCRSYLAR